MGAASRLGHLLQHHPFTYRLALETYRRIRQIIWREQDPVLQEVPAHGPTRVSVEITQRPSSVTNGHLLTPEIGAMLLPA